MHAAAQGHSTIGIPKKVGAEFAKGDEPGKLPKHVKGGEPVHYPPLSHMAKRK